MTQQELVDRVFITKSTISKSEFGLQGSSIAMLKKISEILIITLGQLISDKPFNLTDLIFKTWYGLAGIVIFVIASFVRGIITFATMNMSVSMNKGLVIASGILGIMGGLFGINAIISFIGAAKEN